MDQGPIDASDAPSSAASVATSHTASVPKSDAASLAASVTAPRPRRRPANAFRSRFLAGLDDRDEAGSAAEAECDGPWAVVACERQGQPGFAVLRQWEHPGRDEPRAWFKERELALVTAALLPALGKDAWFRVATGGGPGGHRLEQRGLVVGYLAIYDDRLGEALHIAECLIRSPAALASLLLGASPLALSLVGAILSRQVAGHRQAAKP
jgi:hypothetical protein